MKFRPYFYATSLGLVATAAALAACSDSTTSPAMTADLKLVHANAAAGPVDLEVGGTTVIQDLAYGRTSAVTRVPGGAQRIVLRSGATVVAELDATISESTLNSLLLSAAGAQFAAVVVPDTGAVATDRANIRMVNVVGSNTADPNVLSVKVRAPAPDTVMTFGVDTRIARYGTLMYFDPGEFTFRFYPEGSTALLTEVTFSVTAGQTKAVVLERAADGTYGASVVIEE
jgi:hypothetical protein